VSGQFGELLTQPPGGDALEAVDQPRQRHGRGKRTSRWTCPVSPLHSTSSQPKSRQTAP
jgi:hypothetical protein